MLDFLEALFRFLLILLKSEIKDYVWDYFKALFSGIGKIDFQQPEILLHIFLLYYLIFEIASV